MMVKIEVVMSNCIFIWPLAVVKHNLNVMLKGTVWHCTVNGAFCEGVRK